MRELYRRGGCPIPDCTSRVPCPGLPADAPDSIQILSHKEYFALYPRYEIVMLRMANCHNISSLAATSRWLRCGREPWLRPCTAELPVVRSMDRCVKPNLHAFSSSGLNGSRAQWCSDGTSAAAVSALRADCEAGRASPRLCRRLWAGEIRESSAAWACRQSGKCF